MKKITQEHINAAKTLLHELNNGTNDTLTRKQIYIVKFLGYETKEKLGEWNGYGYKRLGKKIVFDEVNTKEKLMRGLQNFIDNNEKTALNVKKKTFDEKKLAWSKRLSKLTGMELEQAKLIAEEKIDYHQEKIEDVESRQRIHYSSQRQKLIDKMKRENPLRRIKDEEHAEAILRASQRHNDTTYEHELEKAKELSKIGYIEKSEARNYARQNMKKLYNKGGSISPSKINTGNTPSGQQKIGELKTKTISEIAAIIQNDWRNVYFGAVPYLDAMHSINNINDRYMFDDGRTVVAYFLSNASEWKGPVAKQIKAEMNRRLKTSRYQMAKGGRVKAEKFINPKFGKWVIDAKKGKKNIAIDYYDNDQLSAWSISPSGKLMQERTFNYDKESDVMHDIDEARKLIFVDQAFRCGGQPKKMKSDGRQVSKEYSRYFYDLILYPEGSTKNSLCEVCKRKAIPIYHMIERGTKLGSNDEEFIMDYWGHKRCLETLFKKGKIIGDPIINSFEFKDIKENGGKLSNYSPSSFTDEIIQQAKLLSDYQFNKWLQENYPKLFKQLQMALSDERGYFRSKRLYFLKMDLVPELASQIQNGDKVTILLPLGLLRTGIATIKTRGHENTWTLNMGGAHGTPRVADEKNIVAISKSSDNSNYDDVPAAQMANGGQITTYRQILESISNRPGINQQAVEFSQKILEEDAGIDEMTMDDPDVKLLLQKMEAYPVIDDSAPEPVDAPPAEPLPPASRKMLETRLRIINKMMLREPENKTLSLRAKIVKKMISKL